MNEKIVFGKNGEFSIELTKATKVGMYIIYYLVLGTSFYFIWDSLGLTVALSILFLSGSMIIKSVVRLLIDIDQRFMKLENKEEKK